MPEIEQRREQVEQLPEGGKRAGFDDDNVPAPPPTHPAANDSPFELALVRAMVGAAKADGHIDAKEQKPTVR